MKKPILTMKDLDEIIVENLKDGVLTSPQEISQMIINIPGVSVCETPRKDGRYQGYFVANEKKHYVYGKSKYDVIIKLRDYIVNGVPKIKKADTIKVPTNFKSFVLYYFDNFRKKKVAEKTFYSDMKRVEKHLFPYFNEKDIKKITPLQCQKLLDDLKNQGKGKTADELFSLLSIIFKGAIKHGILKINPLDVVFHVQHEKKHGKALTKEEENTLKSALNGSNLLPAFMILLYTGLRPNELTTAKIDENFIVAVNSKRKNRKVEYKHIPISKMLAPYLADVDVLNLSSADYLRRKFKEILPDHILYDLRTTFYSRCKECGVSEHAIKCFMGHSLGALGNAYTDLSDEFLLKEMAKFEY